MISKWIGDLSMDEFRRAHFHRVPLARAATAREALPYLTWSTVASLLERGADLLVARNGRDVDVPRPGFVEAVQLFQQGCSLVLRHGERYDDGLRELAEAVAAESEGDVTIHVFATPAGFHGFAWHYDCEDVFILQTRGAKEYFLRANSVNPRPTIDAMPRDMHYELETSPMMASLLVAGDCLYIPRGWWHVARCVEGSLSLSIGILSPEAGGGTAR